MSFLQSCSIFEILPSAKCQLPERVICFLLNFFCNINLLNIIILLRKRIRFIHSVFERIKNGILDSGYHLYCIELGGENPLI
jgi:hypothetical protein